MGEYCFKLCLFSIRKNVYLWSIYKLCPCPSCCRYCFRFQDIYSSLCNAPIPVAARSEVCLRPLDCWDCVFEFRRDHGSMSFASVVCCQVQDSDSGWLFVQKSPTKCGVSECDREGLKVKMSWLTRVCRTTNKKICNVEWFTTSM